MGACTSNRGEEHAGGGAGAKGAPVVEAEAVMSTFALLDPEKASSIGLALYSTYTYAELVTSDGDDDGDDSGDDDGLAAAAARPVDATFDGPPGKIFVGGQDGYFFHALALEPDAPSPMILPLHRDLHSGWFPLAHLLFWDFDLASKRLGETVRLDSDDLVVVERDGKIERGAFGDVFEARMLGQAGRVFVKAQPLERQFATEIATHVFAFNIGVPVPALKGVFLDKSAHVVWTVMQKSKGISASRFFATRDRGVDTKLVFSFVAAWVLSVAHHMGIIHNDIAARNFLTDGEMVFSLIDFGLSEVKPIRHAYGVPVDDHPVPYIHEMCALLQCAPELFLSGKCSFSTDVYQFGWMLVNIFSQGAVAKSDSRSDNVATGMDAIARAQTAREREQLRQQVFQALEVEVREVRAQLESANRSVPPPVVDLILACVSPSADDRPTMAEVAQQLAQHLPHGDFASIAPALLGANSFNDAVTQALTVAHSERAVRMLVESCGCAVLFLHELELDDDDAVIIANTLSTNSSLEQVSLRGNRIGDRGVKAIAKVLQHSPTQRLRELFLHSNEITNIGAKALAAALISEHCKLDTLTLFGNQIDTSGAAALRKALETLPIERRPKTFSIERNPNVSEAEMARVRAIKLRA